MNADQMKRLCLLIILLATLPLHGRSWSIADYTDSITVDQDGSALVTEKIACVFVGEFHGIFRDIPIEYPGPKGTNFTLYLDVVAITDDSGNKLKYESSNQNGSRHLKIYVPGAVDARREVNISYRVKNGIRHFPEFDEFYWNVTGNDWPVPIDHATAYVALPEQAAGQGLKAQAFTGQYGSTEKEASAKVDGARAEFETTNPLAMRGGFTIDIYIPKGILKEPGALTRLGWFLGSNPILFLPVFAFAVMFTLWYVKGRDPDPGVSVAPMYEPPEGMTPAECGALLSDGIHQRDITSTIVDLAVRGYVKIEEASEKHLFLSSKDYNFRLLKPKNEWGKVAPHERELLEGMFGGMESTSLAWLKNHFYVHLPAIQSYIKSALKQKGMYGVDPTRRTDTHSWARC